MIYLITGFLIMFVTLISMHHIIDLQSFILANIIGTTGLLIMLQGVKRCRG